MLLLSLLLACTSSDCAPGAPCGFDGGAYYVLDPDEPSGRALIYLHGAGTDAEGVRNRHKEERFLEQGFTMVYPDAPSGHWQVSRGQESARSDAAWVAALAAELEAEGVAERFYVSGHSVGGSMTWYVACYEGDRFEAFAPSSGGFWAPAPADCDVRSVAIRHSHGTLDTMVPLEGRSLGGSAEQANIYDGLDMWRGINDCSSDVTVTEEGPYTCSANDCAQGDVSLCLYEGKHATPNAWEQHVAAWLAEH